VEQGQRADKSAVGAINRPLQRVGEGADMMHSNSDTPAG
jgi:hypothetical protein